MKFYRQVEASSGLRQQLEKILRNKIHKNFFSSSLTLQVKKLERF